MHPVVSTDTFMIAVPLAMILGYVVGRTHQYLIHRYIKPSARSYVHHVSPQGDEFHYRTAYPQDAPTEVFPILPFIGETREIPALDKMLMTQSYGKRTR